MMMSVECRNSTPQLFSGQSEENRNEITLHPLMGIEPSRLKKSQLSTTNDFTALLNVKKKTQ